MVSLGMNSDLTKQYWDKAQAEVSKGHIEEGVRLIEEAITVEQSLASPRLHALSGFYYTAGKLYAQEGNFKKAIRSFERCTEIDEQRGDKESLTLSLSHLGGVYGSLGQYDNAIKYHTKALAIARDLKNEKVIASSLNNIGGVLLAQNRNAEAIEYFEGSLKIYQNLGDVNSMYNQFLGLALAFEKNKQLEDAIKSYELAAELGEHNDIKKNIGDNYVSICRLYQVTNRFEQAIINCQKALQFNKTPKEPEEVFYALWWLALSYEDVGQNAKALTSLEKALVIGKNLGDEPKAAYVLNSIGRIYTIQCQFPEALKCLKESLHIKRKLGDEQGVGAVLSNIANIYYQWGIFDKSINYDKQSLEIARNLNNQESVATSLNNIGTIYSSWGENGKAIEYFKQALAINEEKDLISGVAQNLSNIGTSYEHIGNYEKALQHYAEAIDLYAKIDRKYGIANLLNSIASVYFNQGEYQKAINNVDQALTINEALGAKSEIASNLALKGNIYRSFKKYSLALENLKMALTINRDLGRKEHIIYQLDNLGFVYGDLNQNDKGIECFTEAVHLTEELRKTAKGEIRRTYLEKQLHIYQVLAKALLIKGDISGVLGAIEQSRARQLTEQIAGIDEDTKTPTLNEVQKGLTADEAIILFNNINGDSFILMVITSDDVAMQEVSKESFLVKSSEKYQKPVLMLLEKERGIITPMQHDMTGAVLDKSEHKTDFETAIKYYRTLLTSSGHSEEAKDFGKSLYQLLIHPVQKVIEGKSKVTIVPDGILGYLPFETLISSNGNYFIQNLDIGYIQSLTVGKLLKDRSYIAKKRKPILAIGGAVYEPLESNNNDVVANSKQLSYLAKQTDLAIAQGISVRSAYTQLGRNSWHNLPGTLREVDEISRIIGGGDELTGDNVTENTIKKYSEDGKLADYKVLHFATHGLIVPEMPELSAIVLSQHAEEQDGEDGYLRLGEIAKLNLSADFVNLSACDTGLGKIYGGEGVVGFSQSFMLAGANGLSVSLWQVADESTAKFMTELYQKVRDTGIGYNQAMTEVKREFIEGKYGEKYQSPYYWSPFVYYGK